MFLIAVIVAALAFLVLLFIKEKRVCPKKGKYLPGIQDIRQGIQALPIFIWNLFIGLLQLWVFIIKGIYGRFCNQGCCFALCSFNVAFVIVSAPIGKLGDKIGRKRIIASEYVIYFLMALGFIFASSKWHIIALFAMFGIFYAIDEGQSKAYITDLEQKKRGTAIGVYNFAVGLVYLPASIIAGYLWKLNPNYAFGFAAFIAVVAFMFFVRKKRQ